ncbi:MAG: hypothetical protein VYC62_06400 [Verrucomicrobiota bacterium]|nr:hypothetical protein [Verrucomicrobiota bacterium]
MKNIFCKTLALLDAGVPSGDSFLDNLSSPLLIVAISIGLVIFLGLIYFMISRWDALSLFTSKPNGLVKSNDIKREQKKKRKRHKRRRRDHRKRNPTLSEAGGLPPVNKDADQSSKQTEL